ncbi:hypothetical protein IMZ48_11700 [Candidatus Bathyarchaeota archaeon]|nr:hypothetical protein [Candidatus Bathyarchaeota archaeon]
MLQGVGGGSIESELDPRGFPNTLTGWAMEANPSLPPGSSAVPGSDQGMADFEELHLDPEDGATGSPATQQLFRHHDIPRQVHETLSHLPHSRPVSALGRADGSEARPFPVPSQGPRQTAGPAETASTIEPRLTYWSQAEQETNSHGLIARSNQNGNLEASSSALSLHQQPEESADLKPNSNHSRVLDSSVMSPVSDEEQPAETIPQEIDAQKEDAILKVLDRIPTDLLSRYLREKGISSNTDSGRDSGDSGTEQKHLCVHVRCGRKFSRRSELK